MEMNGLVVDFDGKQNIIMYHGIHEYPIGGMIAEYARLYPSEIKDIIMSYSYLEEEPTEDNLAPFFPWFVDELEKKFGVVAAIMITFEFMDLAVDFIKMSEEERQKFYSDKVDQKGEIYEFIFKETHYSEPGVETMEQLLLSCYLWYADIFVAFKHSFNMLATGKEYEEHQVNAFWSMFGENMDFQHIDFKIACYEGAFHSIFTIKSSVSLILFEAAHCMDNEVKFVKCANCGQYFVPEGRRDAIYCNYSSPQNSEKNCREIGAQITRSNKEKNDITTKEYRKVYMKYKMITLRHPEDRESRKVFEKLQTEVKVWRRQLSNGEKTVDEFLRWLKEF